MLARTVLRLPELATALLVPALLLPLQAAPAAAQPVGPRLVPGAAAVLRGTGTRVDSVVPARPRVALRAAGASASATGAVFQVTYTGFTVTQRDAFQRAVDTWARLVTSSVPITLDANLEALPDGVLGAAGPTNFVVQDTDGRYGPEDTLLPIALANAQAGRDLDPGGPDIAADFSNDAGLFSYGPGGAADRYDFTTVVLHEIGHGLGFAGAMDVRTDAAGAERGYWDPGTDRPRPLAFDRQTATLRADGSTTPLLSLPRGSTELANALTDGAAQWTGPAGVAARGVRPELYTPATWEPGSSYSHLDEATYPTGSPDSLMTPALDLGEVVRDPGSVTLGMLSDIGWGSDTAPLRLSGPLLARTGTTVAVTGAAPPGSTVLLYFKRRGSTSTSPGAQPGFTLQRTLAVGGDGRFATTYPAGDDHRYYAQVGSSTSADVLTQVQPTFAGPSTRVVRPGSAVTISGRGMPGTRLDLRFVRGTTVDVVRSVTVGSDGAWSRRQVLGGDLRVGARGANGRRSETTVLLQAR